jgi:AcrR family transcriptional regulator
MNNLRERKKADTHAAIRSAAADLFLRHGYDGTTMEAIAEAANVSVRTVFRYFPTKEDLFFGDVEADLGDLRELLDARPADEPVMQSLQAVIEVLATRFEDNQAEDVRLAPLLQHEPALRQRYLGVLDLVEVTVAEWARGRLHAEPGDLRPGLLAACVVSIQRVVVDAIVAGDERPVADLIREATALLATGFQQLEP